MCVDNYNYSLIVDCKEKNHDVQFLILFERWTYLYTHIQTLYKDQKSGEWNQNTDFEINFHSFSQSFT